ncbi:MAG: phosphotransferase family protein [Nevskiaceae bacterium]|nr:MAG: phosphotransferase family protein [Nevskiaceae bacterium]TBR72032.1 MAG: phosphotransferase family protein [Nevskiaceae bacterium]
MPKIDTLDTQALTPYLEAHIAGFKGLLRTDKFGGGQSNPTFHLYASSGEYVLRRQPPGALLKSAHAVDREFRAMSALAATDVPVPKMCHLCTDTGVIGSMFYVMEFCRGRVLWDPALPEVEAPIRAAMYDEMNRVLAALHAVDVEAVGLGDYGHAGSYFQRQVTRWSKQYRASELTHIVAMEDLTAWLANHLPPDDGQISLVHGDYNINNLIWHPEQPRIIAVIDWELSTLGHPLADLAYQCMRMRAPTLPGSGLDSLYGRDRHALGIPTEAEYVAAYCRRRGLPHAAHWAFCLAFNFFRLAAIAQGIAKRVQQGNASSRHAEWAAPAVSMLAQAGLDIANGGA